MFLALLAPLVLPAQKLLPPLKIVGNLYYVGDNDLASYLVVTPQGGKPFAVVAPNWRQGRIYIASATLNGRPLTTPFLHQADILAGGELRLMLSDTPTQWGRSQ